MPEEGIDDARDKSPYDVIIELQGIIYIFNPPDQVKLAPPGGDSGAAAEESTDAPTTGDKEPAPVAEPVAVQSPPAAEEPAQEEEDAKPVNARPAKQQPNEVKPDESSDADMPDDQG